MLSKILLSLRFPPYCAFYKDESVAGDLSHLENIIPMSIGTVKRWLYLTLVEGLLGL